MTDHLPSTSVQPPRLSVIIPCFNAATTIGAQLEALANQAWAEPWELIIADNGSKDRHDSRGSELRGAVAESTARRRL